MQKWIILIVIAIILIVGTIIVLNIDIETEYVPETEVSQTALRKTIITLYFRNKENGEIDKETKLIDSKLLLRDPYQELLNILISGPENQNLEKLIPEGTKILETVFENGCVTINFSKEFIENSIDEVKKVQAIYTIFETLTELTEVNDIKILIEGEEKEDINNVILNMKNSNPNNNSKNNENTIYENSALNNNENEI
ncbi:MAG TPA: GerMN domain-containing protein [Candidatus Scatovivens faecipullorum]|nr:GerMN domain-containing protein [Candidatus Scatovivens faecipullorum]